MFDCRLVAVFRLQTVGRGCLSSPVGFTVVGKMCIFPNPFYMHVSEGPACYFRQAGGRLTPIPD
ncbi:MAG: hypothetical protein ACTHZ1_11225, partial [Sphingobacterium sp.]